MLATSPEQDSRAIWNNGAVPVILRRGGSQPIRLRLRYADDNRNWLRDGWRKRVPEWIARGKYWELPASRFNDIVVMFLERFGSVYIIQPYRQKEVCATSCMKAEGFVCQCSCMGANHGSGVTGGWLEVSEAFALRYGAAKLACRRLVKIGPGFAN